jgi:para-nitrobenzyl esterase
MIGACLVLGASTLLPGSAVAAPLKVRINDCSPNTTVTGFVGHFPKGQTGEAFPGDMRQFLGIRYARPPTGANRWQPPKKMCWTGNRPAKEFGDPCPQHPGGGKEDCLFLNVHSPAEGNYSNLPVMVYIHPGSFVTGWGHFWAQNPLRLVNNKVIVVTFNYRLGALGFLSHPELDNKQQKRTGNYFFLDQVTVLQWVKNNISEFGGDPNNVTIFGHSAGGVSVLAHLVSPLSNGLFDKAILESGSSYNDPVPLIEAQRLGTQFANSVGCKSAGCLRSLSVEKIRQHETVLFRGDPDTFRIDGVVLNNTFKELLIAGNFKKVPIINGSNFNDRQHMSELTRFGTGGRCDYVSNIVDNRGANFPGAVTYRQALNIYYGSRPGLAAKIERQYPGGSSPMSANLAFQRANADFLRACRTLRMHEWFSQGGGDVYAYEFNDDDAPSFLFGRARLRNGQTFDLGAYHGSQTQYFFPITRIDACGRRYEGLGPGQKTLSDIMVDYWTTFAKTGDPNPRSGPARPNWPAFTPRNDKILSLVSPRPEVMAASAFDRVHNCSSFWDHNQQ